MEREVIFCTRSPKLKLVLTIVNGSLPSQRKKRDGGGGWWLVGLASRWSIWSSRTMSKSLAFISPLALSLYLLLPRALSHYISSPSLSPSLSLSPLEFDAADGIASAHILRAMSTQKFGQEGRKEGLNFLELDFDFYVGDFLLHAER